jgi:hypothetical protein
MKIGFSASALRDPGDSKEVTIGSEEALFCDGSECRSAVFSEDGELELLPPHWHVIEKGKSPDAGPRVHSVWVGRP